MRETQFQFPFRVQTCLFPYAVKPAPLEIKPLPEWEELPAPVRSPITRTFTRE